ncbi:penicillin-binding protein [Salipaludibacillus sp. LMS25]|jgi:penicillin-binding protein|uniref:transglycosylase domain-containing protein n=1 Tax=Salipaludibacillus sp. LMS25 TaxID=2924031 RepID=UPI0020D1EE7F|nr:transglycosylase domain-containing protein [Salipaludibacillus sp. LMS25]UTR15622.1 penicillin-binding protein [Salipaludibacillus sp. LMS25]
MSDQRFSVKSFLKRKEPQSVIKGIRVTSKVFWNLFLIFSTLALLSLFFIGGAAAGYFASLVQDEPIRSFEDIQNDIYDYEEATEIYFANEVYLGDLPSPLERREVDLENISQHLIDAVIATEDEYFYEHEGIVPKALFRAVYQDFSNADTQTGGSTLTQQLIKNQVLTSDVTHDRKALEILLAIRTENFFEKDEILEAYLNVVPFGRNANGRQVAGAQSAAQGIFGVDASELNIAQSAFIAGLPQSPFAYTPFTSQGEVKEDFEAGINRMTTVLNRMHSRGYITDEELEEALAYDVRENLTEARASSLEAYPFVTDEVQRRVKPILAEVLMEQDGVDLDEIDDDAQRELMISRYAEEAERALQREGYKIHTTINKDVYDAQQEVIETFSYFAPSRTEIVTDEDGEEVEITRPEEPGSVLIDNSTGAIISFVGGRDYETQNFNHATQATRHTGSTMKPLLTYAVGFETGVLQPGFITPDTPYIYRTENRPVTNFDNSHRGLMTAREALALSRNVPAVREFTKVDHNTAREALINFGFERFMKDDEPYDGTPLGTIGMTIEANTSAYSTFGNNGVRQESYMIERIETSDGEVVFEHEPEEIDILSPQTNYLMIDMMRDVVASGGTASQLPSYLNFNSDLYGKTGTSQEIKDSWFVGGNPNITQSIWLGFGDAKPIPQESHGMRYNQRTQMLWAALANAAYEVEPDLMAPSERFEQPDGIVSQSICGISGKLPSDLCREAGFVTTDLFNAKYVPTEEDDSLSRVQYVRVNDAMYKALESTPTEFTKAGVAIKEEYFDFADGDISEYIPDGWDNLVPDKEAPDNGKTPDSLQSVSTSGNGISWHAHHEGDVIGYRVYYSSNGSNFSQVASVRWDESYSYSGKSGSYYVTAVDVAGRESSAGNDVSVGSSDNDDEDDSSSNNDGNDDESNSDENENENDDNSNNDNNDNNNSNNNNNATREDEDDENNDNDSNENNNTDNSNNNENDNETDNNDSNNTDTSN